MAATATNKPGADTVPQPKGASSTRKSAIGQDDVLMGRGARATENEGNIRFRHTVRTRLHDYLSAPRRQDKDQIAREILAVVKSRNGRFLRKVESMDDSSSQQGSGGSDYMVVEDDVALLKVKQALRDQKIEEASSNVSNTSTKSNTSATNSVKSVVSPVSAGTGVLPSKISTGGCLLPSPLTDAVLRRYLCEQTQVLPSIPQAGNHMPNLLSLSTPNQDLSIAAVAQARHQESLIRSALLSLAPAPIFSPFTSLHLVQRQLLAAAEAEAQLKLLRANQELLSSIDHVAALRRAAAFQEAGDLLSLERVLKRHKPF